MFAAGTTGSEAQVDPAQMIFEAIGLFDRAWQAVDADLLEQAVTGFRDALALTAPGDPNREAAAANLANALVAKFEMTGDPGVLDEAIALLSKPFTGRAREAGRLATRG